MLIADIVEGGAGIVEGGSYEFHRGSLHSLKVEKPAYFIVCSPQNPREKSVTSLFIRVCGVFFFFLFFKKKSWLKQHCCIVYHGSTFEDFAYNEKIHKW